MKKQNRRYYRYGYITNVFQVRIRLHHIRQDHCSCSGYSRHYPLKQSTPPSPGITSIPHHDFRGATKSSPMPFSRQLKFFTYFGLKAHNFGFKYIRHSTSAHTPREQKTFSPHPNSHNLAKGMHLRGTLKNGQTRPKKHTAQLPPES